MLKHLLFLIILPLLSSCEVLEWKDRALSMIVDQIPYSVEQSLGQQMLPSVLPPEHIVRDPKAQEDLARLLNPLLRKVPELQIKLFISRDKKLNAFAVPGGYLIFNQGLLLAAETPEEILGVAAHEIAHVEQRHSMRSMIQGLGLFAIVTFFLGDLEGIASYIVNQAHVLLRNGFSRVQERESDAKGFDLLVSANIDPRGMSRFFERLGKEAPAGSNDRVAGILSTHPLTEERIQTVNQRFQALPAEKKAAFKKQVFDLKTFQARLRGEPDIEANP